MRTAPMRQFTARRELVPVAVNIAAVVARPVGVIVPEARANDRPIVGRRIIVRSRVPVIGIRSVIPGWIVTSVICSHVRTLCASAQKSCDEACAKNRQYYWRATLGFHRGFHQISPFLQFLISLCCHEATFAAP